MNEIKKSLNNLFLFIYNGACEFNIFQICTIFCMNKLKNNTEGNVSHEHHVHIFVLLAMALAAFLSQIKKFDTLLYRYFGLFFSFFFFYPTDRH